MSKSGSFHFMIGQFEALAISIQLPDEVAIYYILGGIITQGTKLFAQHMS